MKKKLFLLSFLIFFTTYIFSINTFATTNQTNNHQKRLTVILDWFANPDHAPLFVAQEHGFFKKEGLNVRILGPADPADPPKLVAAGKADIGVTYQPQLILQVTKGLPLVRIGTLIATPLNCLVVKANGPIHHIADLKGKKIGYSTGGVDNMMLKTMLKNHGLSLKDVHLINVHYDLTQALLAGKIDAATGMMRNFELIQMKLAKQPGRAFYPEENGMPSYDELVLITNKKEIHDPRLPLFLKALTEGVQYLVNHPQKSWDTFAKEHPQLNTKFNKEAWFATIPRFALRPAALDRSRYNDYAKFLKQEGFIKKIPPLNSYAVELKY